MYCLNCKNLVPEQNVFCQSCGANLKELREVNAQPINQGNMIPNNNMNNNPKNNNPKANKVKKYLIITLIVVLLLTLGISLFFILNKKDNEAIANKKEPTISEENNEEENEEDDNQVEDNSSTLSKLKEDYEIGKIDVNKYFTELVNYEYDYDNLDEDYKFEKKFDTSGNLSYIVEILEANEDKIDLNAKKKLINGVFLKNVILGDDQDSDVAPQSYHDDNYKITSLSKDEPKRDEIQDSLSTHQLDKVYLTHNENFLIWYTDRGSDAITEEQLQELAQELESSVYEYEEIFGVEYLYKAYYDEMFNKNYGKARNYLKNNGINPNKLDTALNVYVFDRGEGAPLGTYTNLHDGNVVLEMFVLTGLDDLFLGESGIVAYPYIIINKRGLSDSMESLEQVANHELFHHMQYLFCAKEEKQKCPNGDYKEAMANVASTLTSEPRTTNNFLNGWAQIYTENTSSALKDIDSGTGRGYGQFPYFYTYSKIVDNGINILMKAHNETDPYSYIKDNTSREDMVKISEELTYNTLAKEFDEKALYTDSFVSLNGTINSPKTINITVNAGAIVYYEVGGDNTVEVISGNSDYVGIKFYGYKDGVYKEIASSMDKIVEDLTYYARYDKFYIGIYNADITQTNKYTIKVSNSKFAENSEFVTTFNNYNIEMEMNITMMGIESKTVSVGVIDELHQKEYLDITTTSMGLVSVNNKMYYDFNSGYSYMTQPYGGDVWWKEKSFPQTIDLSIILDQLISMKNVTKVSDNHYKVKMTPNDVDSLMSAGGTEAYTLSGDIYVEVYTENGYITRLEYDFSELIQGIESFTTVIKYSNYDKAGDVEIPQSIIDNAKEQ